jgi:hypothetical protein
MKRLLQDYWCLPEAWLGLAVWIGLSISELLPLLGRWDVVTIQQPALPVPFLATVIAMGAVIGIGRVSRCQQMARPAAGSPKWADLWLPLGIPVACFAVLPIALAGGSAWLASGHAEHGHAVQAWTQPDRALLAALALWNWGFAALWLRAVPLHPRWGSLVLVLFGWLASPMATRTQYALAGSIVAAAAAVWPTSLGRSRAIRD